MNRMRSSWFVLVLAAVLVVSIPSSGEAALFTPEDAVEDWFFDDGNDGTIWFKLGFNEVLQPFELEVQQILTSFVEVAEELTGYQCVEMAISEEPICSVFSVFNPADEDVEDGDPQLPERGVHYADGTEGDGPINVGIGYTIYGFPNDIIIELTSLDKLGSIDDPVDIGEILDFSLFTVLATSPENFALGHALFSSITPETPLGVFTDNASLIHCPDTSNVDECAARENFQFTSVPEPGSMLLISTAISGVVFRQIRRRRRE